MASLMHDFTRPWRPVGSANHPYYEWNMCGCGHRFRARNVCQTICPVCRIEDRGQFLLAWIQRELHGVIPANWRLLIDHRDWHFFRNWDSTARIKIGAPVWRQLDVRQWSGDPETGARCTRLVRL